MPYRKINIKKKFLKFSEHWSPRVIAEMNDYQFKLAKIKGDFIWHDHKDTDEVFIVIEGRMNIEFRDGEVDLKEGDCMWSPKALSINLLQRMNVKLCLLNPEGLLTQVMSPVN